MTDRSFFFFNDTATTEIYTLSLHDALPIYSVAGILAWYSTIHLPPTELDPVLAGFRRLLASSGMLRSEEHTSELQSRQYLVCRLLLEKKKQRSLASFLSSHFFHHPTSTPLP